MKRLVEVALPLDRINQAARKEQNNPFLKGHPRSVHVWWARRPQAVCRALVLATLLPDPSDRIEAFPNPESQARERERLVDLVARASSWEASVDDKFLKELRDELVAAGVDLDLPVVDPFCGRGSIPIEAQRLGMAAYGADLNPVAVIISKAVSEIPPRFAANREPLTAEHLGHLDTEMTGIFALAVDIRTMAKRLQKRVATRESQKYSSGATAFIWCRVVTCSNPACGAEIPLVTSFKLGKAAKGRFAFIEPSHTKDGRLSFSVKVGSEVPAPTKAGRGGEIPLPSLWPDNERRKHRCTRRDGSELPSDGDGHFGGRVPGPRSGRRARCP